MGLLMVAPKDGLSDSGTTRGPAFGEHNGNSDRHGSRRWMKERNRQERAQNKGLFHG